MTNDSKLIVGIDISRDKVQASYFAHGMEKAESVLLGYASQTYYIGTEGYKKRGENKWAFGDTGRNYFEQGEYLKVERVIDRVIDGNSIEIDNETYMPLDILECLIRYILRECVRVSEYDDVEKISVCVSNFQRKLLDSIKAVLLRIGFDDDSIVLMNRTESFVYYALHAPEELYKRGVGIFDYHKNRLVYSYMNFAYLDGKTIVMVDTEHGTICGTTDEEIDKELSSYAEQFCHGVNMASIYLTGDGFETHANIPEFMQLACSRKRAFMGSNIYAEGAAIGAYEYYYGGNYKNRVLACEDRILADFDIEIIEWEKPKMYRAVRVGTNWYMGSKKLRFIVDDAKELVLHINPIERKPNQDIVISLEEFPDRPNRMTKLMLELDFNSASVCRVSLKDMGFGDYYKSTGKTVYKDIRL